MKTFASGGGSWLRPQFSLASFLVFTTVAGVGIWAWHERPYPVEKKLRSLDPECYSVTPAQLAAMLAQPIIFREVQYMRRLRDGTTVSHGPYRAYDLQGNLLRSGHYRDGLMHGVFSKYAPGGREIRRVTYSRGLANGPSLAWEANGRLYSRSEFVSGKFHGISRVWDAKGMLLSDERYQSGILHGTYAEWTPQGTLRVGGPIPNE